MLKQRPITIRDIAKNANVSIGTVSRVLNGHKSVDDEVRRRVQDTIEAMDYQPDAAARNLRSGTTRTVAIALRDFSPAPTAMMLSAAEGTLRAAGYTVLLANTNNDKSVELDLLREFSRRRVEGIIMTVSNEDDPEIISSIKAMKIPVILSGRFNVEGVDRVLADLRGGTMQATEYLISLGHRRIALLTGAPHAFPATGRIRGFHDAFEKRGLEVPEDLVRAVSFSSDFAFSETSYLCTSANRPTAFITGGMAMLPGVLRALKLADITVGRDVSVVAGCDSDLAELANPPITALSWDFVASGRYCAELLLRRISGSEQGGPRCLILPTTLVLRNSCAPL